MPVLAAQLFSEMSIDNALVDLHRLSDDDAYDYLLALIKASILKQASPTIAKQKQALNSVIRLHPSKLPYMKRFAPTDKWEAAIIKPVESYTFEVSDNSKNSVVRVKLKLSVLYAPVNADKHKFRVCVLKANKLGEGALGAVFDTVKLDDNEYVVKVFSPEVTFEYVAREEKALRILGSNKEQFRINKNYYLIQSKKSNKVDLYDFIPEVEDVSTVTYPKLSLIQLVTLAMNILDKICDLHLRGLLHRDIKQENVMVNPLTLEIELIDLGGMREINDEEDRSQKFGTPGFIPKEIEEFGMASPSSDVFSAGVMLAQIFSHYTLDAAAKAHIDSIIKRMTASAKEDRYQLPIEPLQEFQRYHGVITNKKYNHDAIKKGNEIGCQLYRALHDLRRGPKDSMETYLRKQRHLVCEYVKKLGSVDADGVKEFISVLNIKAFIDANTSNNLIDYAASITDDYYLKTQRLFYLLDRLEALPIKWQSAQDQADYNELRFGVDYLARKIVKRQGTFDEMAWLNQALTSLSDLEVQFSRLYIKNLAQKRAIPVDLLTEFFALHDSIVKFENKTLTTLNHPENTKLVRGIQQALIKYLEETLTPENVRKKQKISSDSRGNAIKQILKVLNTASTSAELIDALQVIIKENGSHLFKKFNSRMYFYLDAAIQTFQREFPEHKIEARK